MPALPVILSCEHGGNLVPSEYRELFQDRQALLDSHRGFDPGAAELAGFLSEHLSCSCTIAWTTRLLVDLNRSPHNRARFSELTRGLPRPLREQIMRDHYKPYREAFTARAAELLAHHGEVIHVSVHSFVPVLNGEVRNADIGLLYDSRRPGERELAERWRASLAASGFPIRVRRNYPYLGRADGFVTLLRRELGSGYLGLELEVNQLWPLDRASSWRSLQEVIAGSLGEAIEGMRR